MAWRFSEGRGDPAGTRMPPAAEAGGRSLPSAVCDLLPLDLFETPRNVTRPRRLLEYLVRTREESPFGLPVTLKLVHRTTKSEFTGQQPRHERFPAALKYLRIEIGRA